MHRHVRICRKSFSNNFVVAQYINFKTLKKSKKTQIALWKQFVIVFTTSFDKNDEYNFRNWKYITIKIIIVFQNAMKNLYFDIECTISLINKKWFHVLIFNVNIRQIIDSIKIRDIDDREHVNFDYVNLNIYFENKLKKKIINRSRKKKRAYDE